MPLRRRRARAFVCLPARLYADSYIAQGKLYMHIYIYGCILALV